MHNSAKSIYNVVSGVVDEDVSKMHNSRKSIYGSSALKDLLVIPNESLPPSHVIGLARRRKAFTLVELLLVLAIISVLSFVAVAVFRSMGESHGVAKNLYDASTLLEFARTEAITRQTYVWVVFANTSVQGQGMESEIRAAAFASQDGTPNTSNLLQLTRILHFQGVQLTQWGYLKPATTNMLSSVFTGTLPTPADVSTNTGAVAFLPTTVASAANQYTVTFTPRGEAMLTQIPSSFTPYNSWLDVSFLHVHGYSTTAPSTQDSSTVDDASVIIDGSTGTVLRVIL
jgi:prepilin-type N-terminal cleavage/methylation domain-containing protein